MNVITSELNDFDAWIDLSREVENLFGPMADEASFQDALRQSISQQTAFCIRSERDENKRILKGGIVISKETNEIAWFVVSKNYRKKGYGRELLDYAIDKLDRQKDIYVQTFHDSVIEGQPARRLYIEFGFSDYKPGGLNPAGIDTVIMKLAKPCNINA